MTATGGTTSLRQRFEDMAREAEQHAKADPKQYERRLFRMALLGYAVIAVTLIASVAVLGVFGGIAWLLLAYPVTLVLLAKSKIGLVLLLAPLFSLWILVRSLFVRVSAPDGYRLTRNQFPALWATIDSLRKPLGALPIHRVIVVPDMQAAVAQTPRLGIFGWHRNTLILGLQMMLTLSERQGRAVLAHEFGHLARSHGRLGVWLYRNRATWARIQHAYEQQASSFNPLNRFINWYVPRLSGYSFALARQQEYEADAIAGELTSPQDFAAALVAFRTRQEMTDETYWKTLLHRATTEKEPEAQTFTKLHAYLTQTMPDSGAAASRIAREMRVRTDFADTHPSLKDRLAALGQAPVFAHERPSAAEAWLGGRLGDVLTHFDTDWLESRREGWQHRHETAQKALGEFANLKQRPPESLSEVESWRIATITEAFVPDADPLLAFQDHQRRFPEDRDADHAIGRLLLERDDEGGIALLQRSAERPALQQDAYGLIAGFYTRRGNAELAESWLRRAEAAYDQDVDATRERSALLASDTYRPHRLTEEAVTALLAALRACPAISSVKSIWLAEKAVQHYTDQPVFVLLIKLKWLTRGKEGKTATLMQQLSNATDLPDTWFVIRDSSDNATTASKIKSAGTQLDLNS